MPREIVHWYVMERAAEELSTSGCATLSECIYKYPALSLLGAIAHDVPYYFRFGNDPFEHVADILHGRDGEDTLQPIKLLAAEILKRPTEARAPYWSFLLGMCSHMAADIYFHPLVFYFTGNYHDADPEEAIRAQGRHRLFETYLDLWLKSLVQFNHPLTIGALLRRSVYEIDDICSLLDSVLAPELLQPEEQKRSLNITTIETRWRTGFFYISASQRFFLSSVLGMLVRGISKFRGDKYKSIDALFTYGRKAERFFDQELHYKNPLNGEEIHTSTKLLIGQSIGKTLTFAKRLELLVSNQQTDVDAVFSGMIGESLNFGIAGGRADEARYFSETGVPLLGLKL